MIAHDERDVITLARTMEGEARGEPDSGKAAIAWIVVNRARRPTFAGDLVGRPGAVAHVCLAEAQFSCWNADDPNSAYLRDAPPEAYAVERAIAERVLAGRLPDPTAGADHYHTINAPSWAALWPPGWTMLMRETARHGGHVFYDGRPMLLSPNFYLTELTVTQQRNLDNRPTPQAVENLRQLCLNVLEPARAALGGKPIYITSGFRSVSVNAAVGGQTNSQHMTGQAADFICPAFGTPREVCLALRSASPRIPYDQLIWEDFNSDWVHVSWSRQPRAMAFRLPGGGEIE